MAKIGAADKRKKVPSPQGDKPATPTRGPSPQKTARTRQAIVLAALHEFLEAGFARATMAKVAKRAGVAKGTPYLYFPNKEALFEGVVRERITRAVIEVESNALGEGETVLSFLRRTLMPAIQSLESSGRSAVARLVVVEGGKFPALAEVYRREVLDPMLTQVRRLAGIALARGELKDDALIRFPHLLLGPIWLGMMSNEVLDPEHPVDIGRMFEAHLDMVFASNA